MTMIGTIRSILDETGREYKQVDEFTLLRMGGPAPDMDTYWTTFREVRAQSPDDLDCLLITGQVEIPGLQLREHYWQVLQFANLLNLGGHGGGAYTLDSEYAFCLHTCRLGDRHLSAESALSEVVRSEALGPASLALVRLSTEGITGQQAYDYYRDCCI